MTKNEFLSRLDQHLSALPEAERRDALRYYEEYFDAAGPENESATAAELGDPAEVARKILEDDGLTPDAGEEGTGSEAPTRSDTQDAPAAGSKPHGPAAIPPLVGILLGIVAVLAAATVILVSFFGVRTYSVFTTVKNFLSSTSEPLQMADSATEEIPTTENSSSAADEKAPCTVDLSFDSIPPRDAVLDIDYGRLTIVVDPGATGAALHCEDVIRYWFDISCTDNKPLTIRYKTPAGYDLNTLPQPEFILSVPDSEAFHFKNLSITSAMGDVEFDNNEAITADSIDLNLAMGSFTCSTVQADSFTANIAMGDFTGGLLQVGSFTADLAMGDLTLGRLENPQACSVQADMGDIDIKLNGKADDYTLELQSALGDVSFNGKSMGNSHTQAVDTNRSITLTASLGDVALAIEQ